MRSAWNSLRNYNLDLEQLRDADHWAQIDVEILWELG